MDTTGLSKMASLIYSKGTIGNFAYYFYLQNQALLTIYKIPNEFINGFSFTEDNWKQFLLTASKDSIDISTVSPKEKADLTERIKASIARQLWRNEGFFEVINSTDEAIKKSLEILRK